MRAALISCLVALPALADLAPVNTFQCAGLSAGTACTTDDGQPGTCMPQQSSRNDYSEGVPPKVVSVEVMTCVASTPARMMAPRLETLITFAALALLVLAVRAALTRWRRLA